MSNRSKIAWTERTWNPVTGCDWASKGCDHCYARRMTERLHGIAKGKAGAKYANGFKVTMHEDTLEEPLRWTKPCRVFVCSMSDLFHRDVSDDFIRRVFDIMRRCPHHTFQLCTKRPERMASMMLPWSKNIWAGTTVESADQYHRIDAVRSIPAVVNWLSIEPMLGPMPDLNLTGIGWVVCGAESGPGARYMQFDWARQVRDICIKNRVAFFLKQLSPEDGGKREPVLLDGQVWRQYPTPVPF